MASASLSSAPPTAVPAFHSLPVQTSFEGTTDVFSNFTSAITLDDGTGLLHAALRGRSLTGKEVCLPAEYAVALVTITEATAPSFSTAAEREQCTELTQQVGVQRCAPSFVQWEHDREPAAAATIPQWIALSSLIHSGE